MNPQINLSMSLIINKMIASRKSMFSVQMYPVIGVEELDIWSELLVYVVSMYILSVVISAIACIT